LRRIASVRATAAWWSTSFTREASSEPISWTNASSRPAVPARSISCSAAARGDDATVAEDDDAVAQRRDFLHHVRREQQALALRRAARAAGRAARARS
jgi:hypothetical protein